MGLVVDFNGLSTQELADESRRLWADIERDLPAAGLSGAMAAAECRPPLDILETTTSVEVVVDLPGVDTRAVRVIACRNSLLIVGAKLPAPTDAGTKYHVAERTYGRFSRAIRIGAAFDAGRARAVVSQGQLHVRLPLVDDRRGQPLPIPVEHE
jgi:HSP20 family protein